MKPALLIVDDDPQVLQAVGIDLRHKYGDRFRVLKADSGATALDILKQLKLRNEPQHSIYQYIIIESYHK